MHTVTRRVYLFVLSRVGFESEYVEAPCRFAWFPCRSILLSNAKSVVFGIFTLIERASYFLGSFN